MGLFDNFPYSNLHEINLNWILGKLGLLDQSAEAAEQYATEAKASETAAAGSAASADVAAQRAENAAGSFITSGRRFILVGDSYLRGVTADGLVNSYGYWFKQYAGLSDDDCYIFAESGAGFCEPGVENNTFYQLFNDNKDNVVNGDGITDIYFIGGYNDRTYNTSDIATAITNTAKLVKSAFPGAKVKCGFIGRNVSINNTESTNLYRAGQAYRNTSSMGYLSGIEYLCREISYFSSDGFHPNETGYKAIGRGLYDIVFTGSVRSVGIPRYPNDSIISAITLIGNILSVHFEAKTGYIISQLNGQKLDGLTTFDLGIINTGALVTPAYNYSFTIHGLVLKNDTEWADCAFTFSVDQYRHLTMRATAADGNTWATARTEDAMIVIRDTTITLPALFF